MNIRDGFLNADGRRLEYLRVGEARLGAPVLVLLHEGLGCIAMWRDFPQRLARATDLEVFLYSRAGYGGSDDAAMPREVGYMHREGLVVLPQVLNCAGIDHHVLVGHSDGASIAIVYAGAAERPGLAGLVLMAPHVFNEALCVASIRQAREAYEHGELRAALARYHGARVEHAFWGWNDIWLHPDFLNWNIEEYLPGIRAPVQLIQGKDDQYGTIRQLEAIEAGVTAPVTRLLAASCGHSPHREQPQLTLRAITEFVARLPACVGSPAASESEPRDQR